jgi:hypothetical protein
MIVPLGIKAYQRSTSREVVLENLLLEKDETGFSPDGIARVKRAGLASPALRGSGPIRALDYRLVSNEQVVVSGNALFLDGVQATGSIAGSDIVRTVQTQFYYFVLGGGTLHYVNDDNEIFSIAMPNDAPPIVDIEQINNYLLILTRSGRFYWIEPNTVSVDPLNFATAESLPDRGVAIRRLGDEVLIFGFESTEIWQTTGDQDAPFLRAAGRNYERGCSARDTVCRFDNGIVWVSDANTVCRAGGVPEIISDTALSEQITRVAGTLNAYTLSINAHELYVLNIPGEGTYVYDASTQAWSRFRTGGSLEWAPRFGYTRGDLSWGARGTSVWQIAEAQFTDAGTAIRVAVSGIVTFTGPAQRNDSVTLGAEVSGDTLFAIRWRDGQDAYGPAEDVSLLAPFDVGSLYRLGQPDQPYRQVEVSSVAPTRMRILGMKANEAWR